MNKFNLRIKNSNDAVKQADSSARDTSSILPARYIKAIIYGPPGSGKTYFLGSANQHKMTKDIIIADVDEGTLTLEGLNVDYQEIREWSDIQGFYEFLVRYTTWRDKYLLATDEVEKKKAAAQIGSLFGVKTKEEFEDFEVPIYFTVAIDTVTELQKKNMKSVMQKALQERPDQNPDVPSVREWGISGNQIRDIIKRYKSLDMHVFFMLHPAIDKDEVMGTVTQLPSLPGKLAPEVPGYVDIVGYMSATVDKETGEFANNLYVQPFGQHTALKDRSGALGKGLSMPTIPKMFDLIENLRKKKLSTMAKPKEKMVEHVEPKVETPKKEAPKEETKSQDDAKIDSDAPV